MKKILQSIGQSIELFRICAIGAHAHTYIPTCIHTYIHMHTRMYYHIRLPAGIFDALFNTPPKLFLCFSLPPKHWIAW